MAHTLENAVSQFLGEYGIEKNTLILVGCSGGVDSVTLVHVLVSLGYSIGVAHVNFQLRGNDSRADALFVEQLCQNFGLRFHLYTPNTHLFANKNNFSIQVAARKLRYRFFKFLCNKLGYQYVALAHHLNDRIETGLYTLIRSKGLPLLGDIPAVRGKIIRPFSNLTKQDIIQHAQNQGYAFREDYSNQESKYLRNKIRINILPELNTINPSINEQLLSKIKISNKLKEIVYHDLTQLEPVFFSYIPNTPFLQINIQEVYSKYGQILLYYCLEVLFEEKPSFVIQLDALLSKQAGRYLETSKFRFTRSKVGFEVVPKRLYQMTGTNNILSIMEEIFLYGRKIKLYQTMPPMLSYVVAVEQHTSLFIRPWRAGDFITLPSDQNHPRHQPVSKLLTNDKYPVSLKPIALVVVCESPENPEVICIPGLKRYQANPQKDYPQASVFLTVDWA